MTVAIVKDHKNYPGELATPEDVCRLAAEYQKAAYHLLGLGRRGDPISRAPCRMSAIHSIELYLNALLLHKGHKASGVRGLQHDLTARADLAITSGLQLRKRTIAHLHTLTGNREYLVMRYGPEMASTVSQINRLTATLEEVAAKVTAIVSIKQ